MGKGGVKCDTPEGLVKVCVWSVCVPTPQAELRQLILSPRGGNHEHLFFLKKKKKNLLKILNVVKVSLGKLIFKISLRPQNLPHSSSREC